ncbi:MAG: GNAT family protein [Alphaproteobacteria bacterium]
MLGLLTGRGRRGAGPRLAGERVYLTPPRVSDWRAWADLRSRSREFLVPWEPTWPHDALTRSSFRRRVRAHAAERRHGSGFAFLIRRRADHALLGAITIGDVQRSVAQSCSLGYWIGQAYARQGYMTEALRLALRFAFDTLTLHRAAAACLPNNGASQALLRKLGFQQEGYAREYLRIDGRWQDHVLFGLLATEFERPALGNRAAE